MYAIRSYYGIDNILKNRKTYENNYKKILDSNSFSFQEDIKERERVTWLVSILVNNYDYRDTIIALLKEKGIDSRPFFYPLSDT